METERYIPFDPAVVAEVLKSTPHHSEVEGRQGFQIVAGKDKGTPPTTLHYFEPEATLYIDCDFAEISIHEAMMLRGEGSIRFTGYVNPSLVRSVDLEVWPDGSLLFSLKNKGSGDLHAQ